MEPEDLSLPKRRRFGDGPNTFVENSSDSGRDLFTSSDCSTRACNATLGVQTVCFSCEKYFCNTCTIKHKSAFSDHVVWQEKGDIETNIATLTQLIDSNHMSEDLMKSKLQPRRLLQAKHIRDGNNCWISGCTILSDGRIAVVDFDNNSIKIINVQTGTIEQYFKSQHKPWDITELDQHHLAVTCPEAQSLIILSFKEELRIVNMINVNVDCHGIASVKSNLFITSTAPTNVQILDRTWKVLQTIDKTDSGVSLFGWPLYIAVSPDTGTLLISDYTNDKVVRLTKTSVERKVKEGVPGTEKDIVYVIDSGYQHASLKYPRGMVHDDGGSVFLAGRYNVHQMTIDCGHIHIPLDRKDGIEWAQCVAFCTKRNLLFVGKHRLNTMSNLISVFHVE